MNDKKEYPLEIRSDKTGIILQRKSKDRINLIFLTWEEVEKLRKEIS